MTAEIVGPIVLIAVIVAFLALTIAGLISAFSNHDVGWGIGIIAGWIVGLGWLIAAIYLATHWRSTGLSG